MNTHTVHKLGAFKYYGRAAIAIYAGILAAIIWLVFARHIGFDLSDEGYLWYGTQRILHGEVPMRDFLAYDLGRYIYCAIFLLAFQDTGLMTIRLATSPLIGILVGMMVFIVISNEKGTKWLSQAYYSVPVALLALVLVYPYYKVFDLAASVLLVLAVSNLFSRQNRISWGLLGFIVGLVAVINRNHGVYGVVASTLACVILMSMSNTNRPQAKDIAAWAIGILIGYTPTLFAFVFIDGFFQAFLHGIQEQFRLGQTNLPIPVPWPWLFDLRSQGWLTSFLHISKGLGFVLLIAFPIFGAAFLIRNRSAFGPSYTAFSAALCVAIPYSHYAFSRADFVHLTLPLYPVMIGLLTIPISARVSTKILFTILLIAISIYISDSPVVKFYSNFERDWVKIIVRNDEVFVEEGEAQVYAKEIKAIESHAVPKGSFVALPNMPGLHAIYESRIPIYDIYILSKAEHTHEMMEVRGLNQLRPNLILISNHALDSNDSRRFSSFRPDMYKWINDHYRRTRSSDVSGWDSLEIYTLN